MHRILPRADGTHWDGMFYWNAGIGRGTAYIFRPNSAQSRQVIQLAGLDPQEQYRVRGEDGAIAQQTQSGKKLMEDGLLVNLPSRFSSQLIYVEAAAAGR